jgi:hypothetical protein
VRPPATTALALRPCMALVRVEPPAHWLRGRLRALLLVHLEREFHREQLRRAFAPYLPEWLKPDRWMLALCLGVLLSACGAEPAPPGPRPPAQAALSDMAPPAAPDGAACLPCRPDQPDTCLGAIGRCELSQGRYCCSLPWPYSCRWHTCSQGDPSSCQGGTCQPVSGGSCCVYGAQLAPHLDEDMADQIKRAADRDDARSVERRCGKNFGADFTGAPRRPRPASTNPEMGGDPSSPSLMEGALR